jgi:hypothetical protein
MISTFTDYNLFLYINRGGNLERLFNKLVIQGKIPIVFNHSANAHFIGKGRGSSINQSNFREILK